MAIGLRPEFLPMIMTVAWCALSTGIVSGFLVGGFWLLGFVVAECMRPASISRTPCTQLMWWIMKNRSFDKRLIFALNGLGVAWQRESSFRIQVGMAGCAIAVLVVLRPPLVWWAAVVISIALVLATELVNSAFEALVDHLHPEVHPEIRVIKDMVAGSVLFAAAGAGVVGLLMLASWYWD